MQSILAKKYFIQFLTVTVKKLKKEIFSVLKIQEEPAAVIHFIFNIEIDQEGEFIREAAYLTENLDEDIVLQEARAIVFFVREIHSLNEERKEKLFKNKGQFTEVKFSGDKLSGIMSELKRRHGDDLEGSGELKLAGGGNSNSSYPITNLIQYGQGRIA